MKLPGIENAEVGETKIVRYLLSTTHRAGKSKAGFFMEFGFSVDRWEVLDRALRQHAMDNEIAQNREPSLELDPLSTDFCRLRTDGC
jgi:hypothetical protein